MIGGGRLTAEDAGEIVQLEIQPLRGATTSWTVEAIDAEGSIYKVDFHGPGAEARARAYRALILQKPNLIQS